MDVSFFFNQLAELAKKQGPVFGVLIGIIIILVLVIWRSNTKTLKAKDDEINRLSNRNEKLTELLILNKDSENLRLIKQNEELLNRVIQIEKRLEKDT